MSKTKNSNPNAANPLRQNRYHASIGHAEYRYIEQYINLYHPIPLNKIIKVKNEQ